MSPVWWEYLIGAAVAIVTVYAFVSVTRFQTRRMSSRTDRTAEDLYDKYADSPRKQRRYARERSGRRRSG